MSRSEEDIHRQQRETEEAPEGRREEREGPDRSGEEASRGEESADREEPDRAEEEVRGAAGDGGVEADEEPPSDGRAEAEEEVEGELERLRTEVSELNDRHLRLAAEFDNYRRRSRAELDESRARAQADLVGDFLEVLDDLERVRDVDPGSTSVEAVLEGIEMVSRKFVKVMDAVGVEAIDPAGEPFDPELMEAMTAVPADSEEEDDTVHEVFQKGYRLDGQLIRPARVSVRKTA